MAYDPGNPYQPPRRPGYGDPSQNGHYNDGPYATQPGQPRPSLHHSASQPHPMNNRAEYGARGGRPVHDAGAMRSQSQRRPSDGMYDAGYGIEDGMRNMHVGPPGPGARRPPGPPGSMRGGAPYRGAPRVRGGVQGAPPRAPPMGWDRGRGGMGPPPQQRMPPPRAGHAGPRGGYPGRPPILRHNTVDSERVWTADSGGDAAYGDYRHGGGEPPAPAVQRSMTMPSTVAQPQYKAYNPAQYQAPSRAATKQPTPIPELEAPRAVELDYPRESVGALLDSYYGETDHTHGEEQATPSGHYAPQPGYGVSSPAPQPGYGVSSPAPQPGYGVSSPAPQPGYGVSSPAPQPGYGVPSPSPARTNFSRPVLSPPLQGDPSFAQQAHRSRSQPSLRDGYRNGATYDGAIAEAPAHVPPLPLQAALQAGSPVPRIRGSPAPSQMMRRPSAPDSLPVHPSPSDLENALRSNDSLPMHPPPIRPGLMQEYSGHPPPVRQHDMERNSISSAKTTDSGPITHQELSQLRSTANLNPSDPRLQLALAKKLVEAASVLASEGGRADVKTTRKNREAFTLEAHKVVKKLTSSTHPYPEAMFYMASCYGEGLLGLQVDHERGFGLYQSAAKLNYAPAAYRTAVCCELGAGVRKDPHRAIMWYKKAASLGETPAMFKLGMIQWKGLLGQPRNPREGITWLKRAADQADDNNQHALHELALLHEGEGSDVIIPDMDYARDLFTKAGELGYAPSQFRLGCAFEYGQLGCPVDPRRSIAWYSKAAMKGDLEAQLALSGWYLTGSDGVIQQSDTEAYLWARKAAEKGLAKAEYALGYFTEVGIGVPANLDEAKRWYYKAASQQHPKAQLRLTELKKGGMAAQKSRERLSRSNVKNKDDGDCVIM